MYIVKNMNRIEKPVAFQLSWKRPETPPPDTLFLDFVKTETTFYTTSREKMVMIWSQRPLLLDVRQGIELK